MGHFFVGRSTVGGRDGAIKAAVALTPSGTLPTFSGPLMPDLVIPRLYCCCTHCPAYLILSLSSADLIIPHLSCCLHRLASLLHLCCCCINRLIICCPYPESLSSSVSDSAFIVNLVIPYHSHPPPSPLSRISASTILLVLHLYCVSDAAVSIVPRLCH